MLAECRIRRLKIHSQEAVVLPRITALLEESIRTASLPNIPPNGVLCIRRLDLGRITIATNSRFLSRRLDELVRNLSPVQITIEAPEQDETVVWFADDIEPYRCFSQLLALGRPPRAWYWPAVVPGWSQSMSVPESLLVSISQLVQKSTGLTGLSYALEPLVRKGTMLTVLENVRPRELGAIINGLPLSSVPVNAGSERNNAPVKNAVGHLDATFKLHQEWQAFMRQALQRWRPDDVRLRLAFNLALSIAGLRPNTKNSEALVQSILRPDISPAAADETTQAPSVHENAGKAVESEVMLPGEDEAIVVASEAEAQAEGDRDYSVFPAHAGQTGLEPDDPSGFALTDSKQTSTKTPQTASPGLGRERAPEMASSRETGVPTQAQPASVPARPLLNGNYSGDVSAHGGFLFLIPLMRCLGMDTLMQAETGEADPELLLRVLWRIAGWIGIPAEDTVLQFMGRPLRVKADAVPFMAPAHWRVILGAEQDTKLDLIQVRQQPSVTVIRDPSSRLVLGAWRTDNSEQLPAWLDSYPRWSNSTLLEKWTGDNLVDTLVLAMCRYLRQYAQMSMCTLIRRHAHIAVTRTHVDWSASLLQLDNRVRMAGLDIDPGWVPWLQRVFYFHYIEEET